MLRNLKKSLWRITFVSALAVMFASLIAIANIYNSQAATSKQLIAAKENARAWAGDIDLSKLTLGDGKRTTTGPTRGWIYACDSFQGNRPAPGAVESVPWIHGNTWNIYDKVQVFGGKNWTSSLKVRKNGQSRVVSSNGVPSHITGEFPIAQNQTAAKYDPNPNRINAFTLSLITNYTPKPSSQSSCIPQGPIGILSSGAVLFGALDEAGRDAPAHEIQDACSGHPQQQGLYHYHSLPMCIDSGPAGEPSKVIGWAIDGYPITGPRGPKGVTYTNKMLDACHGTTGPIKIGGRWVRSYHYVATMEFPYTIGCFRGTPQKVSGLPALGGVLGGGPPQKQGGAPPQKGSAQNLGAQLTQTLPSNYTGWVYLQSQTAITSYRWLGQGWALVYLPAGAVYVSPYSAPWRYAWTQSTGWVVTKLIQ